MISLLTVRESSNDDQSFREILLCRSDSFLYLISLHSHLRYGTWNGEMGLIRRPDAERLANTLERAARDMTVPMPYNVEVPVMYGATVERAGLEGNLHKELCVDIGSASLSFRNGSAMLEMAKSLRLTLPWAA